MKAKINLEDIPKYISWPARLLGMEAFPIRTRNTEQIMREYDREKWGSVLDLLKKEQSLTDNDLLRLQGIDWEAESVFMIHGEYFIAPAHEVMKLYEEILLNTIKSENPEKLIELGCGLGDKLLFLAKKITPKIVRGGEFTASGVECGRILAKINVISAHFQHFDYNNPETLNGMDEGAIIYTSHSIEQIPFLKKEFIEGLIKIKPKKVIHFEPCYEDQDSTTITGLMRKKYIEINDYNRNLVSLLMDFQSNSKIEIVDHQKNIFSDTPFNPTSVITWKPIY